MVSEAEKNLVVGIDVGGTGTKIGIVDANGNILAGNLPKKNQKIAVEWVLKNKDKLLFSLSLLKALRPFC